MTFQVINLNSGTCPYGSCPNGEVPTAMGHCTCPSPSPPGSPTPPPVTPAPTTPPCPSGLCGAGCSTCCYSDPAGAFQAYCVPNGSGGFVWTLVQKGITVPSGAFPVGTSGATDPTSGCQTDCQCNLRTRACSGCT